MARLRRLPFRLAVAAGAVFALAALALYPVVGETWGMVWFMVATPFSSLTKSALGFEPYPLIYVLVTTLLAATFWATSVYVLTCCFARTR